MPMTSSRSCVLYVNKPAKYGITVKNAEGNEIYTEEVDVVTVREELGTTNSFIPASLVTIGDEIGKDSFSRVFKGEYKGTTVAVKKIRVRELAARKFAQQEIWIHEHLFHPNIVFFMGACLGKGHMLLLMEYIDGPNLEGVLFDEDVASKYPELTVQKRTNIASQVVQALCYLHGHNPTIIHCDLKPANVFVSGNFDIAKLGDLGISKVRQMNQTMSTANKDLLPGTPSYLAPKVIVDGQKTNTCTDIWSLGCTLYELFTERECWSVYDEKIVDGDSSDVDEDADDISMSTLKQYMRRKLPPYQQKILDGLNKTLSKVIGKCLMYDARQPPEILDVNIDIKSLM